MVDRREGSRRTMEKDPYVKSLLKLKQQEDIIERGLTAAINNMKIDTNFLQDIVHEHRELSIKRQAFLNTICRNMEDITSQLESAKSVARNSEEIKKLDVNTYKLKLIKLSQKVQDFEQSCPVQALMEEQAVLDTELREFESQLQKYENISKTESLSSCQSKIENGKEKQDYKEVHDFHSLVAKTGHTKTWSLEDHLFFLKMRKKCENIPTLVAAVQKKCPDLSTEAIVNHEAWYKHYQNLREKQKSAVREWRKQKDLEKTKSIEDTDENNENCLEHEDDAMEIEAENKISIPKEAKARRTGSSGSNNSADSNKSEKKELIKKWRLEKERKRSMDEEQLRMQAKLKQEMEKSRRKKQREKVQGALEEYRRRKSLESASRESSAHSKEKCKYDSTLIKAFRKQDEEYTRRRKDLIQRLQRPIKSEAVVVKRAELSRTRSCSTLLNSTKGWREKCKAEDTTNHANKLRYVKDIPKMCIQWRNLESGNLKNSLMLA